MYKKICVPVDNSEYSNAAIELAVALGKAFGAELVGSHVIAAGLHVQRFRQMEAVLPEKYRDPATLERQRQGHGSLMAQGLRLIADSYLDMLAGKARAAGLPFARKVLDGKNYAELVRDIRESGYDLVILGARGLGVAKDALLGSVCERVVRRVRTDTLVAKHSRSLAGDGGAPILVGVDGSPQSCGGLAAALALSKAFGRPVEAVAVYDPALHGLIFHRLVGVLSGPAARLFRSEEQARLHDEVIDAGLATIYRAHLEAARRVAADQGMDLKTTLLAGKAFEAILRHVRDSQPWLLVLGRIGFHGDEELDIGSTSENLLRLAPCHVLLTSQEAHRPMEGKP